MGSLLFERVRAGLAATSRRGLEQFTVGKLWMLVGLWQCIFKIIAVR